MPISPPRRRLAASLFAAALILGGAARESAAAPDHAALRQRADAAWVAGDFRGAHALYREALQAGPPAGAEAWARFRAEDALWRALVTEQAAAAACAAPKRALEILLESPAETDAGVPVALEAYESLGDLLVHVPALATRQGALPSYSAALRGWAARPGDAARAREERIWRKLIHPPAGEPAGNVHETVPAAFLEKALAETAAPAERAYINLMLALALSRRGPDAAPAGTPERIAAAFEAAIREGAGCRWWDDAVYDYAHWLAGQGPGETVGSMWIGNPDYPRALELYGRLQGGLTPDNAGACRVNDVPERVAAILKPTLVVSPSRVYLPGEPAQVYLGRRNVARVRLTLRRVDLAAADYRPGMQTSEWPRALDDAALATVQSWEVATADPADHLPHGSLVDLPPGLPAGGYLLEAEGDGGLDRAAFAVSEVGLLSAFADDAVHLALLRLRDGAPVAGARVRLFDGEREHAGTTDAQGAVSFAAPARTGTRGSFTAFAGEGGAPAFTSAGFDATAGQFGALLVATGRPFYRPPDEAAWRLVARRVEGGRLAAVAAGTAALTIANRSGNVLDSGQITLDAAGAAAGVTRLGAALRYPEHYGEYTLRLEGIGEAPLLALWDPLRTGPKGRGGHAMGRACSACHNPTSH